jgi:glycosyltransferase involved in cell wall biosynthesis
MTNPLVSIIIPTYNRAGLVVETLESIREQTYPELELLVIDDGSKDDSVPIVRRWVEQHRSRFRSVQLIANPFNQGKSAVVNQGFDTVTGEYVMVFDSDDLLLPDAISAEVAFFQQHPEVDSLCAGAMLLSGDVRTGIQFHSMREGPDSTDIAKTYGDLFLKGNAVISSTVVMKREVMKRTGYFNTELRVTHDWDYWIRISRNFRFGFLNTPVVYYRVNSDGSISQNKMSLFNEVLKVMRIHAPRYSKQEMLLMMLRQIRGHMFLAKNDRNWPQCCQIAVYGLFRLPEVVSKGS